MPVDNSLTFVLNRLHTSNVYIISKSIINEKINLRTMLNVSDLRKKSLIMLAIVY